MIAVLTRPSDDAGIALVRRWRDYDAHLLTSADLMRAGWVWSNRGTDRRMAVIDGELVPESAIDGVLVRTSAIEATELGPIIEEDREYCAAEMTAFLVWWLSSLRAKIINRPTATSLMGPGWRPATWHLVAQRFGLTSARPQWRASEHPLCGPVESVDETARGGEQVEIVTVVGGRVVGSADPALAGWAVRLAATADAEVLSVAFDSTLDPPAFCWAEPMADVSDAAVADALLESLLIGSSHQSRAPT